MAVLFVLPPVICWILARIFVFPVLVGSWGQMSPAYTGQFGMLPDVTRGLLSAILIPVILAPLVIVLVERRTEAWTYCRPWVVNTATWVVNGIVLLAMGCLGVGLAIVAHTVIPRS
jgi:hypothetical protein